MATPAGPAGATQSGGSFFYPASGRILFSRDEFRICRVWERNLSPSRYRRRNLAVVDLRCGRIYPQPSLALWPRFYFGEANNWAISSQAVIEHFPMNYYGIGPTSNENYQDMPVGALGRSLAPNDAFGRNSTSDQPFIFRRRASSNTQNPKMRMEIQSRSPACRIRWESKKFPGMMAPALPAFLLRCVGIAEIILNRHALAPLSNSPSVDFQTFSQTSTRFCKVDSTPGTS